MKTNVKQPQKKQSVKSNTTKPNKQNKKQINKKKNVKIRRKIVAFLGLLIFCIIIFNIVIFSNLFKIRKITVINNSKLNAEEIIQNSGLKIGNKLFRPSSGKIKNKVQENAYIEHAKITKKINGEVIIDVQERTPTYMLQLEDGYGYINNQGYILEVSQIAMELPIMYGKSQITCGITVLTGIMRSAESDSTGSEKSEYTQENSNLGFPEQKT